jgi:3'(2'), 5'-bisphosphate nucleotidase
MYQRPPLNDYQDADDLTYKAPGGPTLSMHALVELSEEAGRAILNVYNLPRDDARAGVEYKDDKSPLTAADLASNEVICSTLAKEFPDVPILSEENKLDDFASRSKWQYYFCVDACVSGVFPAAV